MGKAIAVIGSEGFVGSAFCRMVQPFYQILRYDPAIEYSVEHQSARKVSATQDEVNAADVGVVCVPTPMAENGSCDVSIVEEVIEWLDTPLIVIKSTVAPGTTIGLKCKTGKPIIFSPEHTSARKYHVPGEYASGSDMTVPPMVVAGGTPQHCQEYFDLLIPILGSEKQYIAMGSLEAELTKYMSNFYGGVAVTFANEMYEICKALGADWYKVWSAWGLDPKMPTFYTAVFPEDRGFGGTCLPKDTNALAVAAKEAGYDAPFVNAVLRSNERFRGDE